MLDLKQILKNSKSAFLFGPRGVGKTWLSKEFTREHQPAFEINLLFYELYRRYINQPQLFRKEVKAQIKPDKLLTVFIDEVQKLPILLDEVHSLIESEKSRVRFLLTGSSARKLKRGGANLLAGRAWTIHLHPLTHREIDLDLDKALQFGTLPGIYLGDPEPKRTLISYVETYLKEEIMQEVLVRKVEAYVRFLDIAGQMNGEPLNYSSLARDCGVSVKTIQEYISILIDTLIVFKINAWTQSIHKQLRQSPKIYFFDCGVLNAIRGELAIELKPHSYRYGKLFETFIIQEIIRLNDYYETGFRFYYWRTNSGLEVDIILSRGLSEPPLAVEIKSKSNPLAEDMRALKSFKSENPDSRLYCLCTAPHKYQSEDVSVFPWKQGLKELFP